MSSFPSIWMGEAIEHGVAVEVMEARAQKVRDGDSSKQGILYLEHEAVITTGRETLPEHVASVPSHTPLRPVNRGGQATYHGPGILVGYLVIDLKQRKSGAFPDLHEFLRCMEQGIMDYLSVVHALPVCRREGFTGVWTPGYDDPSGPPRRKISAMGISCRRWVTAHGFALNFHPDLEVFRSFVPCGITDAPTTSLQFEQALVGRQYLQQPMKEVVQQVHQFLCRALAQQGWTA